MDLKKLFGYENKNVVITGAASVMSKSACELLLELGANVYAIDINPIALPVKKAIQADLGKQEEIERVVRELPEQIDALFLCHAIAGYKGKELQVQLVNFFGQKYMVELLLPRLVDKASVTFISSVGGMGFEQNYKTCLEVIDLKNFEEERKIRLNAICPGYTLTGLTDDFNKSSSPTLNAKEGQEMIENMFIKGWNGYPAEPKDMGYPLVVIGSDICSYMSGQVIYIDYGLTSNWKHNGLLN